MVEERTWSKKKNMNCRFIQSFMPQQLTEEALDAEIEKAIQEAKASSVKDMRKVMKVLMPRVTGESRRQGGQRTVENETFPSLSMKFNNDGLHSKG